MNPAAFDVIVVGAGPAGSITAYLLATAGIRTAVLDASVFPRPKACGGGLQVRTLRDLPFDVSHLFRGTIHRIRLSYELEDACTRVSSSPLVHNIIRSEFDHYLLLRAQAAGAAFFGGASVRHLEVNPNCGVAVHLEKQVFRAQFLVGADGANSVVRGLLSNRRQYFWQTAVYCEIPEPELNPSAYQEGCMTVDLGSLPSGYAWVLPKHGYVNIGAGGPLAAARLLKSYVARFVERLGLLKSNERQPTLVGHQLPTLMQGTKVGSTRVLLVGDAAGVVEPFTGDGIAFAIQSARIAAERIRKSFDSALDLTEYQSDIFSRIGSELVWSRQLLSLSTAFPRVMHYLFKTNERVWETFCRTLRGEASFQRLRKDILGPLECAWSLIYRFAQSRERRVLQPKAMRSDLGAIS